MEKEHEDELNKVIDDMVDTLTAEIKKSISGFMHNFVKQVFKKAYLEIMNEEKEKRL